MKILSSSVGPKKDSLGFGLRSMRALTLFQQNFSSVEKLLQLYQLTGGIRRSEAPEDLKKMLRSFWEESENASIQHASNDRITLLIRSTARIPDSLMEEGGFDFLLRQAVIAACTSLETFFWDSVFENIVTILRARRAGAAEEVRNLTLTLEEYLSIEQYGDPDQRLGQIILKNFERKILSNTDSIDQVARILTVRNFWEQVEKLCGEPSKNLRRLIGELISRRNQVVHRGDRPSHGEQSDIHGLKPITFSWTNLRVQASKTLVTAAAEIFTGAVTRLQEEIQSMKGKQEGGKPSLSSRIPEGVHEDTSKGTTEE